MIWSDHEYSPAELSGLLNDFKPGQQGTYPNYFRGDDAVSVLPMEAVERLNPELARRLKEAGPDVEVPIR